MALFKEIDDFCEREPTHDEQMAPFEGAEDDEGGNDARRHDVADAERHEGFGASLHNAIVMPYIIHYGTEEQKKRWLPKMATGELISAIAMTEPGARRPRNRQWLCHQRLEDIHHQRPDANLICVVAKTDPTQGAKGTSLLFVETDGAEGFERGRNLNKMGQEAQDTSELFFNDVKIPAENLLGTEEGKGFYPADGQLPQERLNIAVQAIATIERALKLTIDYVKQRKAFGKAVIIDFQNTQFVLAECKTEGTVARVFVNHCIGVHLQGKLDASTASMAKYWLTDLEGKIVDRACSCSAAMASWTNIRSAACIATPRPAHLWRHQRDHEGADLEIFEEQNTAIALSPEARSDMKWLTYLSMTRCGRRVGHLHISGKKDGSLHEVPAVRLGAHVLESIRDRNGLDTGMVDDIIFGASAPRAFEAKPGHQHGGDARWARPRSRPEPDSPSAAASRA
jgi:hypothetical protein